ncbi:hypothetical protein CB0940_08539 [Cercospora beticola]|uniref:Microsomal glutathione S-transferase 3 n=2 Tax=Cercospora TaxID=29002 RepID=A0A2G5HQ20_CERBT|nr:hypothetical protein CB0940_08539 [Cercospora beticola]XP_044659945.1 uncharacterized protein CKM354_000862400 [Cercospora kikuchii]PIA94620.1 hypothetical protein CB0940_08539 [Cercospora beticola]WPB05115.1 hypothetical protein RHO25_009765 [Cercospora beticola]GIZ45458.1 hypothetical protein CKM354_000862400 [Cercospora kikuchii]
MTTTITVPKEYGYVVATTAFTFFLSFWHGARAGMSRKPAQIKAPKAFADSGDMDKAVDKQHMQAMHMFNCKQRAHYNYLEYQPSTALAMLIAGVEYPMASTYLGIGWIVGRIIYAVGYTDASKEDGKGRIYGYAISQPLAFVIWGLAGWSGYKLTL